jgi:hypothetical protein
LGIEKKSRNKDRNMTIKHTVGSMSSSSAADAFWGFPLAAAAAAYNNKKHISIYKEFCHQDRENSTFSCSIAAIIKGSGAYWTTK